MIVPFTSRRRTRALAAAVVVALVSTVVGTSVAGADQIDDKKAEAQQIAGKIYDLQMQIEQYAEAANGARVQLDQLNVQMAAAQQKVEQAEAEQAVHRAELKAYALNAYVYGPPPEQVDVRIDPAGLSVDPRNSYLQAAASNRQQLIDKLRTAEANLKTQLAALDDAKRAATDKANQLQQQQAETQSKVDELQSVKNQVDGELATLVQQAADERAAAEREAAQQAEQQAQQSATASSSADTSTPPPSSSTSGGDSPPTTVFIPSRPIPPGPVPPPDTEGAAKAIEFARAQLGKPYIWGAAGPDAYDCSGLTMQAWKAGGVTMDHWTGSQYAQTRPIPLSEVQPGDLIFYNQFQHVALYIGDGKIIHAPHAGDVVHIEDMYYWRTNMAATRPGVPIS